jgi:exopolyphosphatase/guanosine-5'-triphosphate,3'-diphosphate pyrophosphatase
MDRTLTVLGEYRTLMDACGVTRARLVATSAARDADNVEEFLAGATEVTGVRAEVLTGDEEGRYSFAGATASLPPGLADAGLALVVDIGGGSTELVVGRPLAKDPRSVVGRSLDIGCVRISERMFLHDPPLPEELAQARAAVKAEVHAARAELPALTSDGLLIGLAGTVSTLSCLEQGLADYDRARVHHTVIEREAVARWLRVLAAEESRARLAHPGMVVGREEVIVAGLLILDVVMAAFDCTRCLVSEDDILDGLVRGLQDSSRRG